MSLVFPYIEQNGILKNFFANNTKYYEKDIEIISSTKSTSHSRESGFNFDDSNYCLSMTHGFCFKKGTAFITGYELKTTSYRCKLMNWTFSGSNNKQRWEHVERQSHELASNTPYHFAWNHGMYRCYLITGIPQTDCSGVDIMQIEVFGTYFPNGVRGKSCYIKRSRRTGFCFAGILIL